MDPARIGVGPVDTVLTSDGMVARWQAASGGAVLHVGASSPSDGSPFWFDTDESCGDAGASFTDDFNRANNTTLGPDWTVYGTWHISANQAYCDSYTTSGIARGAAYHSIGAPDHQVTFRFTNSIAGGPIVRVTDQANCYRAFVDGTTLLVYKRVAGVQTQIGTTALGMSPNDEITFRAEGTALTVLKNGSQVYTLTDSSITAGTAAGIMTGTSTSSSYSYDDAEITTYPLVEAHPLKMWDGTQWLTVACVTV